MGNVWFVLPSARPHIEAEAILSLWRERGYRIGLWRDPGTEEGFDECLIIRPYEGYAKAVNALAAEVLRCDAEAEWIVTAGDDTEPDLTHTAQEIAADCAEHFEGTFGVMQCTGDRWGESRNTHAFQKWPDQPRRCVHCGQGEDAPPHMHGAYIDRVAGSPWLGRSFCERINQGNGPLWPEYFHMGVDDELQQVAQKYGVLWQRPDLIHLHKHWGRKLEGKPGPTADSMPKFLTEANTRERWDEFRQILDARKAAGFPGSEPL